MGFDAVDVEDEPAVLLDIQRAVLRRNCRFVVVERFESHWPSYVARVASMKNPATWAGRIAKHLRLAMAPVFNTFR